MVFHKDRAACTSATLAHDLYMVNAHPVLPLLADGERGGLPCQRDYVNNHETLVAALQRLNAVVSMHVFHEGAKRTVITVVHGAASDVAAMAAGSARLDARGGDAASERAYSPVRGWLDLPVGLYPAVLCNRLA